ncbi:GntR family transcriptional regulator [Acidiphilium cryptum]|uniref:Transcriptional regulator, GntR family n=1 Tax=Acidiphilium cryptum (strain JF-5) TaxID=349163 RepID=A5FTS8_ACICJ|nr:GntR family transcriptional regulator [Acidiphilium cryptum]ABQ29010.1 transcriptional regulator, GntR family [Acidiphilium cryptum JF-5]
MTQRKALKIIPQPMRRQVEDGLRKAIIAGVFPAGAHLSDRLLCETFGASRSIVREAVRLLEAEGLVVVHPNRGPFVASISATEAEEIYELRAALEGLAGEGFARRATTGERAALRHIYEELAASGPATSRETLLDIKRRFYDVLTAGCRNAYVSRILGQLLNRNSQLRATSLSAPGRLPHTVAELGRIVDAIDRRDAAAAGAACRDHVHRAAEAALRIIGEREATCVASSFATAEGI